LSSSRARIATGNQSIRIVVIDGKYYGITDYQAE